MQTDKKCVHDAADFFSREEEEAGLLCRSLYIITSYLLKHAASQIRIAFHENPCKENVVPLINIP
mgnify:CR=1 FL=1